jgi:acyl carrier protein
LTPSVDTTDNFFRSGGDSILVTRLAARIPELFGVEVPLSTVLQSPTFGDLARTIDEIKTAERAEPTYELKPINRTSAARRQIQSSKGDHRDR